MATTTKDKDPEALERAYRLGLMTMREMRDAFGVATSTILRRAKKGGWTRDLSEQVKLETKARVSAAAVEAAHKTLTERLQDDATAVQIHAMSNAAMIAEHEGDGTKSRKFFSGVIDLVTEQMNSAPSIEKLVAMAEANDPLAVPALRKVLSIPSYVDSAKKAIDGIARAIEIECRARNLDDAPLDTDPITVIERRIIG
ncbi:MAG: hypothetical protein Q8O52_01800 [Sulfuritalea sp.]|nr:hypothetical protein [Sulfuritalea sp.]